MSFDLASESAAGAENEGLAESGSGLVQTYHFPGELIGGSSPLVKGEEEALAWQAAAEACDSERIHFVWRAQEGRVWYLAVRSQDLASFPRSWCPFASLLPGMPDARPAPVIYTFFSDEAAALMAVDKDSLQIIRGTPSIIRAKAERMAREMNGAGVVDLQPDVIVKLKAVEWESLSLLEDRARRFLGALSVVSGLLVTAGAFFVWFMASIAQITYHADLDDLRQRSTKASYELQQSALVLRASGMRQQIAAFNRINDGLVGLQGWLKLYLIKGNAVKWWAVVPANLTAERISELGAQTIEAVPDGLVIANAKGSYVREKEIK